MWACAFATEERECHRSRGTFCAHPLSYFCVTSSSSVRVLLKEPQRCQKELYWFCWKFFASFATRDEHKRRICLTTSQPSSHDITTISSLQCLLNSMNDVEMKNSNRLNFFLILSFSLHCCQQEVMCPGFSFYTCQISDLRFTVRDFSNLQNILSDFLNLQIPPPPTIWRKSGYPYPIFLPTTKAVKLPP